MLNPYDRAAKDSLDKHNKEREELEDDPRFNKFLTLAKIHYEKHSNNAIGRIIAGNPDEQAKTIAGDAVEAMKKAKEDEKEQLEKDLLAYIEAGPHHEKGNPNGCTTLEGCANHVADVKAKASSPADPQAAQSFKDRFPNISRMLDNILETLSLIDLAMMIEYIEYYMDRKRDDDKPVDEVKEDADIGTGVKGKGVKPDKQSGGKTRQLKKRYKKVKFTHKHRLHKRRTQKHRRHRKH